MLSEVSVHDQLACYLGPVVHRISWCRVCVRGRWFSIWFHGRKRRRERQRVRDKWNKETDRDRDSKIGFQYLFQRQALDDVLLGFLPNVSATSYHHSLVTQVLGNAYVKILITIWKIKVSVEDIAQLYGNCLTCIS